MVIKDTNIFQPQEVNFSSPLLSCARARIRTWDPASISGVLYQLSYARKRGNKANYINIRPQNQLHSSMRIKKLLLKELFAENCGDDEA